MRLWTLHPKYLDAKGLVALWREGLLAKAVLEGKTKGYINHPQLIRFRAQPDPHGAICAYLQAILAESIKRGYRFDATKLPKTGIPPTIEESQGQLMYEWLHLLQKLSLRDKGLHQTLRKIDAPEPHPLFRIVPGGVKPWEKASPLFIIHNT